MTRQVLDVKGGGLDCVVFTPKLEKDQQNGRLMRQINQVQASEHCSASYAPFLP